MRGEKVEIQESLIFLKSKFKVIEKSSKMFKFLIKIEKSQKNFVLFLKPSLYGENPT